MYLEHGTVYMVYRWAKPSHLQHFIQETRIPVGEKCSWFC